MRAKLLHLVEVYGQLHTLAAVAPTGKSHCTHQTGGRLGPEVAWMFWRTKSLVPTGNWTIPWSSSP